MSDAQVAELERKLVAFDDSTSNQVAIITIPTLDNYPIEEYSTKIFREWGIGNKKTNNGVLILAVIDDHKVRIEVGYGLEGAIPDVTANKIIQNDLVPNFRSENYYEGFDQAATSIIKAAAGEYKAPEGYRSKKPGGKGLVAIIILVVIVIILSSINRGGGGGFMSRRGYRGIGPVFWPGGGWSGGGGGGWSGGGGGFGGFGGGSSGGGGASGSW